MAVIFLFDIVYKMPLKKRTFRFVLVIAVVCVAILLYYSSGYFFIYNNDAYVDADLVNVTPTVSGPIAKVAVQDNQRVKKGALLLQLLQTPFDINIRHAKSTLDQAVAEKALLQVELTQAKATVKVKQAQLQLATLEWHRFTKLYQKQAVSKEQRDEKTEQYRIAQAELVQAQQAVAQVQQRYPVEQAKVAQAMSLLGLREYEKSQSTIYAPTDGLINHLRVYRGDYAQAGTTLFGFIDDRSWRVVANIKESNLVGIAPGKTVWVYLSSRPWHLYRGVVQSIGHGVARQVNPPNPGLPYIKPVTNWIRYDYRIPVRIRLHPMPRNLRLHMGTDARVFVF